LLLAAPSDEVSKEIQDLNPGVVKRIDETVWLVDGSHAQIVEACLALRHPTRIGSHAERTLPEIEQKVLALLQTGSREVSMVWADVDVFECDSQEVLVTPIEDLPSVKVYHGTDDVADGPSLAVVRVLEVPLEDSVAVVGVRVLAIADPVVIVECRVDAAPADLHEAIGEQGHLVVKDVGEYGSIGPD